MAVPILRDLRVSVVNIISHERATKTFCRSPRTPSRGGALLLAAALGMVLGARPAHGASNRTPRSLGVVEFDKQSEFSHIRVRKLGSVQSLLFVRDNGEEVVQSMVNLKKPYELLGSYSRTMFASYLFWPRQERALVGLGGGAMVHFLQHYEPS